jgi:hypothetical protein
MRQQLIALLMGEVSREVRGTLFRPAPTKSAPAYSDLALPRQVIISQEAVTIDGRPVTFSLRGYPPDVFLIEARIDVANVFSRDTFGTEDVLYKHAYRILEQHGGKSEYCEEYSIFAVSEYEGAPEQFFEHGSIMASLLKSERLELDPREIEHTLQSTLKYARNDLAVVDWDGAFLFDDVGNFEEDVEILVLANVHLLRHRMLDRQLDERLERMAELVGKSASGKLFRTRDLAQDLRDIMKARMASISELQRLERDIKLIGDWYSARLFDLATSKFKLEEWRRAIRGKLESVEDVYSMMAENFSVSGKHRAEWIQIIAFFILQIGWFLLIILEFTYFTRK